MLLTSAVVGLKIILSIYAFGVRIMRASGTAHLKLQRFIEGSLDSMTYHKDYIYMNGTLSDKILWWTIDIIWTYFKYTKIISSQNKIYQLENHTRSW